MSAADNGTLFRVLDSAPRTAAGHMALDKVIIEAHSRGLIPNTLRFLQFKPCALVGLHQNTFLEVNVPYCRENGIDINRRITGGGSLYWGRLELGWELYAGKNTPGIPRQVEGMYRLLCEAMAAGLRTMGLEAAYRPVNDIEIRGRKIAGTGGTELAGSFVFQCSLLVDFDIDEMLRVLRFPLEKLSDKAVKSMRERVTSVKAQLGYVPADTVLKQAVLTGLRQTLAYEFVPGELTARETALLAEYLPQFESPEWIYGQAGAVLSTVDCTASYKAPGGLIRVQMRLDEGVRSIKYLFISGDFFAYPARVINDLETALKNTPVDSRRIAGIIREFFRSHQAEIPGVAPEHFIEAVLLAVEQAKVTQPVPQSPLAEVCCEAGR
ncbi:Lipoate-protein ligase A [uncultured Sporomusa sp.]|uniref:lipoate--protein ligase n=1 Tax=uncultured Sporomusa sp. TaxID=307249 RepID=A0A212LMS6_9FIRM|nr:lipoate protein ligase C-terminal domain-containing protein [uncultured Sporomusa sp.]SCM78828.1 Lipoate-protein ligase A [uncultured Sporomusa sp.]